LSSKRYSFATAGRGNGDQRRVCRAWDLPFPFH